MEEGDRSTDAELAVGDNERRSSRLNGFAYVALGVVLALLVGSLWFALDARDNARQANAALRAQFTYCTQPDHVDDAVCAEPTDGEPGQPGAPGDQGPVGEPGSEGPQGSTGPAGPTGVQGPRGKPGRDSTVPGPIGLAGTPGDDGQDAVGPQGQPGPAGPKGDPGAKGDPGDTGPQGPEGPAGYPESFTFTYLGVTFVCSDPDEDRSYDCEPV